MPSEHKEGYKGVNDERWEGSAVGRDRTGRLTGGQSPTVFWRSRIVPEVASVLGSNIGHSRVTGWEEG